jgi:hypothetical protein
MSFVEFGAFTVDAEQAQSLDLEPGEYLALLTHSGSRTGAGVRLLQHARDGPSRALASVSIRGLSYREGSGSVALRL